MKISIHTAWMLLLISTIASGQSPGSHEKYFPSGLSLSYGYSFYAVKDQFISDEKYSGNAYRIIASWSKFHNKNGFRFGIDYLGSKTISNYNIITSITEFNLYLDYLYPVKASEKTKKIYVFLGPTAGTFVYANQLEKDGEFGTSSELKRLMEQMENTETELVNKVLTHETLMRQQEILNQLLKSEEAELERDKDEKRESTTVKNQKISNPLEILEYKKQRLNEVELLKTIPPSLNPFYKRKVNEYFYKLKQDFRIFKININLVVTEG